MARPSPPLAPWRDLEARWTLRPAALLGAVAASGALWALIVAFVLRL
ncbi:hypothetical protein [Brevundimonas sp.]